MLLTMMMMMMMMMMMVMMVMMMMMMMMMMMTMMMMMMTMMMKMAPLINNHRLYLRKAQVAGPQEQNSIAAETAANTKGLNHPNPE